MVSTVRQMQRQGEPQRGWIDHSRRIPLLREKNKVVCAKRKSRLILMERGRAKGGGGVVVRLRSDARKSQKWAPTPSVSFTQE